MGVKSYKDLIVWQKSIDLVKEIFLLTKAFPATEVYGLTSQLRRASVAIPSNIAEGSGRRSAKEYAYFYSIAYGSALEVETQIIIAKELRFATSKNCVTIDMLIDEILRMLNTIVSNSRKANV